MGRKSKKKSPTYTELIIPTFKVLKKLGGSGTNREIYDQILNEMKLTKEAIEESHLGSSTQTELQYQLAWARTYLKNYGVISNSRKSVWSILPKYSKINAEELDYREIIAFTYNKNTERRNKNKDDINGLEPQDDNIKNDIEEFPEENKPWRNELANILHCMDPFAFERLAQRLLRECGFVEVNVTQKTNDGGIDGTGKLKINGMITFNIAFQCKRYKGSVSAKEIRDFRGSLKSDVEKGVFITTGNFTQAAKKEASESGKKSIDLMDGEEFIDKLIEYEIGIKEVKTYVVDENFFNEI